MSRVAKKPQYEAFNHDLNCFGRHQEHARNLRDWRQPGRQLMLEVGAGKAEISLRFAQDNRDWQVLAIDRKSDRLHKTARDLNARVDNLAFLQTDIKDLPDHIDLNDQVDLLWLAFPDPYPSQKQAKHRLTNPDNLYRYRSLLKPGGLIRFKTDSRDFFDYTRRAFEVSGWLAVTGKEPDLALDSARSGDVLTVTTYEQKFREAGLSIYYLQASVL